MSYNEQVLSRSTVAADVTFKRTAVNAPATLTNKPNYDLDTMLTKVVSTASDNNTYQQDNYDQISNSLTLSDSSVILTKSLQTSVIDRTDAVVYTKENILFDHWIYLSAKKIYKSSVYFTLPKEGTNIRFTAQEAVGVYLYATHKVYMDSYNDGDILSLTIPKFRTNRVIRLSNLTLNDFKSVIDYNFITNDELQEIIDSKVDLIDILSVQDFSDLCDLIFDASQLQYAIYSSKENYYSRAQAQAAVDRLYCDEDIVLDQLMINNQAMTYQQLLDQVGLNLNDYTIAELTALADIILTTATGITLNNKTSLAVIQDSMVSLLTQLSSYSIQIVKEINSLPITIVPHVMVRCNAPITHIEIKEYIFTAPVKLLKDSSNENSFNNLTIKNLFGLSDLKVTDKPKVNIKTVMDFTFDIKKNKILFGHQDVFIRHRTDFDINTGFDSLTIQQRQKIFNSGIFS